MSELPDNDFYPETLVEVSEWGEWQVKGGKPFRVAVVDDLPVRVYETGVVLRDNSARLVSPSPASVVSTPEAASALRARRYEKAIEQFQAGMIEGAKKVNPNVHGLGDAVSMIGEAAMRTAAKGGRDGITAAKFIFQAADLAPKRPAAEQEGEGRISFSVAVQHLPALVGALVEAAGAAAGAGAVIELGAGQVRDVGEAGQGGGGEEEENVSPKATSA